MIEKLGHEDFHRHSRQRRWIAMVISNVAHLTSIG